MSTLWTPRGEVTVDRDPQSDTEPEAGSAGSSVADPSRDTGSATGVLPEDLDLNDLSPEERQQATEMIAEMAKARERLLETPAAVIVANHGMGLYELAALHLSEQPPNFGEATLAIDAFGAVVDSLAGRLGDAEPALREGLDQLRKAYVELKSRA